MISWRLKGCGRCGGDVLVEASAYALAVQESRWEPPMPAVDGRGRWERRGGNPSGNLRPENTGRNIAIRELRAEGSSLRDHR